MLQKRVKADANKIQPKRINQGKLLEELISSNIVTSKKLIFNSGNSNLYDVSASRN